MPEQYKQQKQSNPKLAKIGMSRETGTTINRKTHIKQSIGDILTTPIGSRIQRREYGSHLFDLIDSAGNEAGQLRLLAATVDAINHWEPRVLLDNANLDINMDGKITLDFSYHDIQQNELINDNVIL